MQILMMWEKIKIKRGMQTLKDHYEPVRGDSVDVAIAEYCNQEGQTVPVKRIDTNQYMFGTLKIETIPDKRNTHEYKVKVLKDKKTLSWEQFFKKYEANELKKLEKIGIDQELHVDEESKTAVFNASPNKSTPNRR